MESSGREDGSNITRSSRLPYLFDPQSIAILGASDDPRKWGNFLSRGLIEGGFKGEIFLVNPHSSKVLERATYPSIESIGRPVDLAVIALPASSALSAVKQSVAAGARGLLVVSAGFGEVGEAGVDLQSELVATVRAAGVRMVGPNCMGYFCARSHINLTPIAPHSGSLGLISQSGNLSLELMLLAHERALGFSNIITCGNQADLSVDEMFLEVANDPGTQVVAMYLEGTPRGRALIEAITSVAAQKPVIVLKAGLTAAGARTALSHTGVMAQGRQLWQSMLAQSGAHQVASTTELIMLAECFMRQPPARGRRVAVLSDGGGHAALAADAVENAGLLLPTLSEHTRKALGSFLPAHSSRANPIDMAGAPEDDLWSFIRCAELLLGSGEVDSLMLVGEFGGYGEVLPNLIKEEVAVAVAFTELPRRFGLPILQHSMYANSGSEALQTMRSGGIPISNDIQIIASTLARFSPPALATDSAKVPIRSSNAPVREGQLLVTEAMNFMTEIGITVVPFEIVGDEDEAAKAALKMGFPAVVKGVSRVLLHKTDTGAVVLNCADADAVRTAYRQVTEAAHRISPQDHSVHALVSPMLFGMELIVGALRDPTFGPIIMVGFGGIYAEMFQDVSFRLAPIDVSEAGRMLSELTGYALLNGARGLPPCDISAINKMVARVSEVIACEPEIMELDLNPVMVSAANAIVADARVIVQNQGASAPPTALSVRG